EQNLRRAVQNKEFTLYYQPKLNLESGQIYSVEALIRWNCPNQGWVSPDRFIPLAEETGLIDQIGKWVFKTACKDLKSWELAGLPPIVVSINLSTRQFMKFELMEKIQAITADIGIEPKYIEFEVTESALMNDPVDATRTLQ